MMSCFEWNSRSSDYLDGTLIGQAKRDADEHLDHCKSCSDRCKHFRIILTSISNQPRSALPIPIRKSPFTTTLPRMETALGIRNFSRARWEKVPWYIRTTVEGCLIVFVILLGISTGPRLRALYERGLERSLSEFTEAFNDTSSGASPGDSASAPPLARGNVAASAASAEAQGDAASGADDFASEGGEEDQEEISETEPDSESSGIRPGKGGEIWRFNLKTDSPHELRAKIVQILAGLKVPANTPGLGGIEAPGGIQFDLLVSQSLIPSIKKQLQKIAPPAPEGLSESPMGETFTWFHRNQPQTKHPIPEGQARVVIWLSQM